MIDLDELRATNERLLAKARTATLEYSEGLQSVIDGKEMLAEIERLRAALMKIAEQDRRDGTYFVENVYDGPFAKIARAALADQQSMREK